MELKFDEKGLIPAIVQDHYTKQVLTLAYMNAETLALTIAEGRTVFWSRSRQEIWRKGETSGNVQRVVEKGKEKILKKVGEECTEVIIAGEKEDKAETVYEISDLAYHVLVLMVSAGITVEDVTRELEKRHVIDHKVKQERMQ